jgi:uncharacterized protein YaeQ
MALSSTIYKADITLADLNTHKYEDLNLTMAMHPSENESRMMYRLVAFLHSAHPDLEFTKGLSSTNEPELWQKGLQGEIKHWIELGEPDEKRIRQACGKSEMVSIFTTKINTATTWYDKIKSKIPLEKVNIYFIDIFENGPIEKIVSKSMRLSCTIEETHMYLGDDHQRIGIEILTLEKLKKKDL